MKQVGGNIEIIKSSIKQAHRETMVIREWNTAVLNSTTTSKAKPKPFKNDVTETGNFFKSVMRESGSLGLL